MPVLVSICKQCGHVFEGNHLVLCKTCLKELGEGIWKSMNESKLWKIAEEILTLFENNRFTTDIKIDSDYLKKEIVKIIQDKQDEMEANRIEQEEFEYYASLTG